MVKMSSTRKAIIKKVLGQIREARNLLKAPKIPDARKLKLRAKVDVLRGTVRVLRDLRD